MNSLDLTRICLSMRDTWQEWQRIKEREYRHDGQFLLPDNGIKAWVNEESGQPSSAPMLVDALNPAVLSVGNPQSGTTGAPE